MSVSPTYNTATRQTALRVVCLVTGMLVMAYALFGAPGHARADDQRFGFSKLLPPISKFRLPNLGDISIWKSDMQKAKKAYREGKYGKARKHLKKALKKGNFIAAWYLGHIYRLGLGVQVNRGKAFHYYRTVALEYEDIGLPPRVFLIALDSLVRVADGYRTGIKSAGIKRDYRRAVRLYNKAATRGHPAAQYGLANMFLKGQGVKRDNRKAVRWIRLAARKRFPPALAQLGDFAFNGKYVRKNRVKAVAMYIVATRSGNEALHPDIFDRHDQLAEKLTVQQYQKALAMAEHWIQKNELHRTAVRKHKPRLLPPPPPRTADRRLLPPPPPGGHGGNDVYRPAGRGHGLSFR